MSEETKAVLVGGCQCGAVRYALFARPSGVHICHCRMCQRAMGGPFAALAPVKLADFVWTEGKPGFFRSSSIAERGFCRDCGTPLSFRYLDSDEIDVTISSLDQPEEVEPQGQYGIESRMPWFDRLAALPGSQTDLSSERATAFENHQRGDA